MEEEVIQLVCLRDSVDGLTNVRKFGVPSKRTYNEINNVDLTIETTAPNTDEMDALQSSKLSDDTLEGERATEIGRQTEVSQIKGPNSLKLLEKQINIQQQLYESISNFIKNQNERFEELNANQKKMYRAIDRLSDRQKNINEILRQ